MERRIVHDMGRTSVASSVPVAVNGFDRNSSGSIVLEADVSDSRTAELQWADADGGRTDSTTDALHGLQAGLMVSSGNPSSDGIPGDNVVRLAEDDSGRTVEPQRPNDGRARVPASTVIGRQSGSTLVTAIDISRRTEAVDQSSTLVQRDASLSHAEQNIVENSASSFILYRDGQVMCVVLAVAVTANLCIQLCQRSCSQFFQNPFIFYVNANAKARGSRGIMSIVCMSVYAHFA